jgi:UBA/TS-N domain
LQHLQALQGASGDISTEDIQRHMAQALRQAELLPREGGAARAAVAAPFPPPPAEIVVNEPDEGAISQLQDMGFSAAASRRALLLTRNQVDIAVNHLIAHAGEANTEAEPTQEELRCAALAGVDAQMM